MLAATMSSHVVTIDWKRTTPDFAPERYVRDHLWSFGTGTSVRASATSEYRGNPQLVNPEEALVAALSSCHMLTFLAICAKRKLVVDSYVDRAVGQLEKGPDGKLAMTRVTLEPRVAFAAGTAIDAAALRSLHDAAHANCFIANSVRTAVTIES
jgi:organic hydroperoxide reductase OsmC/OhrA